jgi:TetR/AcrR family transcriptional regulator, tetracycline repressor protein
VGRRKGTVIDRQAVIEKALEVIDRDGLDGLNIRKLGDEIGFNGASLYHHFKDKDEILREVQHYLMETEGLAPDPGEHTHWREVVSLAVTRHRASMLKHPNCAPLMVGPARLRSFGARERLASMMLDQGVPARLIYTIIDSVEVLASGSALLNPQNEPPRERLNIEGRTDLPNLRKALRSSGNSSDRVFKAQLNVLLDGWETLIAGTA